MDLFEEWRMDDIHTQSHTHTQGHGQGQGHGQRGGMEQALHEAEREGEGEGGSAPMFTLQRLDWSVERCAPPPPPPPSKSALKRLPKEISKAVVVNHMFVFGTTDGSILRWSMDGGSGSDCDEVELSKKPEDNIKHLFVDPSGHHVIASLKNGDSYYLHSRSSKAKKMSKLQGHIEAVGFDKARVSETNTKSFLVGTSTGRLYELAFESSGKEKVCQLVHQLDESSTGGITSIYFETFSSGDGDDVTVMEGFSQDNEGPGAGRVVKSGRRIFVMCTTSSPTRLYHFLGGPSFSQLFQDYKASGASSFVELPGSVERSELLFHKTEEQDRNQSFSLLTKQGMYHGSLLLSNSSTSSDDVLTEAGMTPFVHRQHQQRRAPLSVLMTEFHFLLLYADALVVQSRISGEVQQEENLFLLLTSSSEDSGEAVAMVRDAERNSFWLVTTTSLFQIEIRHEDRLAWQMYLDKAVQLQDGRLFDTAHQFCKSEEQRKKVHRAQADFFLTSDQIEKAATQFALAGVPFDEVLLLLLTLGAERSRQGTILNSTSSNTGAKNGAPQLAEYDFSDQSLEALRLYLREKLRILPPSAKSQKTMIATWLCEIYLHTVASAAAHHREGVAQTVQEFKDFLRKNKGALDNATTMSLLLSRGQAMRPLLLFFSQIIGDYEKVVSHYINENMVAEAISVLKNAPIEKVEELIYKKAPILMARSPELAVELFLSKAYLAPTRLLPALFRYSELLDRQHQAARENSRSSGRTSHAHDLLTTTSSDVKGDDYEDRLDQDSDGARVNFAVYYLQSYLTNSKERERNGEGFCFIEASVQHALIWLLAKYDDANESGLLKLIVPLVDSDSLYGDVEAEVVSEECLLDRDSIDISYVLRECKRENRTRSCVYLYVLMNFMEKAVAAALEIDLSLAKSIASRYQVHQSHMDVSSFGREGKDEMMLSGVTGAAAVGKKLWLRIIEHVVLTQGKGGVSQVLQMLHDSKGLLRIEDILEHLPDFTEIDLFKEEICNTLEDYANRIETLKSEMDELSSSAETIDKELAGVTTRGFAMRNHQRCEGCSEALQSQQLSWEQFYLFPCGHGYHEACLLKKSGEYLEHAADIQLVASLKEQISAVSARAKDADKRSMVQMEHLQAELDALVAADCPLCGDYMIRSTGLSLLSSGLSSTTNMADESKSWEL